MTRRLVLAAVLAGTVGAGTALATTLATGTPTAKVYKVCIVAFHDPNSPQRDGLCVWTPDLGGLRAPGA